MLVIGGRPPVANTPLPTAGKGAPTVGRLVAVRAGESLILQWSGAPARWEIGQQVAACIGYAVYADARTPLRVGVYPPLRVEGVSPDTPLYVAPLYRLPDGREVAGAASPVSSK